MVKNFFYIIALTCIGLLNIYGEAKLFDPLTMSAEEVEVLQELAKRDEALKKREKGFQKEILLFKAAEKSLDEKLRQCNLLKNELVKLLKQLNAREDKEFMDLVKMYEKMRPRKVAGIFSEMDMPLAIQFIKRMNKKKVGPILAEMDVRRAKDITLQLTKDIQELPKTDLTKDDEADANL